MEGGNLRIVAFEVREVEVIGKGLLLPREPTTKTHSQRPRVTFKRRVQGVEEATSE